MAPFLWASTWFQALLRSSLWLSVFWVLLCPVHCSHGRPKWRFTTSEVVIPKKVPKRMGGSDMPDQLTYSMHFRGQRHVVHMKLKKNIISENFPVYTTNDQGAPQVDSPFVPRDCYFYSYLEGVPGSLATLNTCNGGLNGMLQIDDFTYEIKPLASSSKFEHVISLLVEEERLSKSEKCSSDENVAEKDEFLEETELAGSPRAVPVYLWRVHVKLLRVHYTMDNSLSKSINNFTVALEMILIANNIANSIYKLTGLSIYTYAVTIWEQKDLVNLGQFQGNNAHLDVLEALGRHERYFYSRIEQSMVVLFTAYNFSNKEHSAIQDGVCIVHRASLYVQIKEYHMFLVATIMSHEMGHSLNLNHDGVGCFCFRRTSCVMHAYPGLRDMLSNCSQVTLQNRKYGWDECMSFLRNTYNDFKYEVTRCGDNNVNGDEECDCGSLKECSYNKCCTTECRFTEESTCDTGACCQKCQFSPAGTLCRDKLGICDLPEYCYGISAKCPDNFYIQDGTPCSPLAVCMSGNCSDRDLQCQALFGYQVKDASPICYKDLNVRGDRFGNCGLTLQRGGTRPYRCELENVYCGMLHCDGVKRIPGGGEHTSFHHIKVEDVKEVECFGYDIHDGSELPEIGLVVDGATCGPGKFCKAQVCVFHQTLNFTCKISVCNFRGVCNNRGNCHCMQGWQPPFCEDKGAGGSMDSGTPMTTEEAFRVKIHVYVNKILLVLFTRMALILASLLFGGISKAIMAEKKPPPAT
ncbi:disintegrin and metalloproteinase domain-containing protein 20-like [Sigmodon hispidus]